MSVTGLGLVLFLLVAGCAETPDDAPDGGAEPGADGGEEPDAGDGSGEDGDGDVEPMHMAITASSPMSMIPIRVAEDQGFFEDEGVQLGDILEAEGGATTLRQVLDGDLALGDVATGAVLEGYLSGAPIQAVGSSHQQPYDFTFATMPDSDLGSIEEMEGMNFGVTNPGSASDDLSYVLADAAGMDIDAYERVVTGGVGGGIAMLEGGEIDLSLITPLLLAENPDQFRVAFEALDYIDAYQKTVYVTTSSYASENPGQVEGALAAIHRGMEFVRENPEQAAEIFSRESDDFALESLIEDIEFANERGALEGGVGFNVEGLQNVAVGLSLRAGIDEIPWSEIFDPSYLPEGVSTEIPEDTEADQG